MKPTPGPWTIDEYGKTIECTQQITTNYNGSLLKNVCVLDDGEYIEYTNREQLNANARLIAAAPELLEALERAYNDAIRFLNEGDFKSHVEWDASYIVEALAKAKGSRTDEP